MSLPVSTSQFQKLALCRLLAQRKTLWLLFENDLQSHLHQENASSRDLLD